MKGAIFLAGLAQVEGVRVEAGASPIRKIVNLLEKSSKALDEEGKKEDAEFKKFKCWCDKGAAELKKEAEEAARRAEEMANKATEDQAEADSLKQEVAQHQSDRKAAETDLAAGQKQREKEHNAFIENNQESLDTIDALKGAIAAIQGGIGSFLQNAKPGMASALQNAMDNSLSLSGAEKDTAISLLMGQMSSEDSAGSSGEVVGMLKQMLDEEEKAIAEDQTAEDESAKGFAELMEAKQAEIKAAGAAIESKQARLAEVAVSAVEAKNAGDNSGKESAANADMLAEMEKTCKGKDAEFAERVKMRQEEQAAVGEAINILSNDDAMETFRQGGLHKAGGAESFLQRGTKSHKGKKAAANKAMAFIKNAKPTRKEDSSSLALIASMIKVTSGGKAGAKADFSKVTKMIDGMVALLEKEQEDDTSSRETCLNDFREGEISKKDTTAAKAQLEAAIDSVSAGITNSQDEIAKVEQEIVDLDESTTELTQDREESHVEASASMAEQKAMIEILNKATARLKQFYQKAEAKKAEAAAEGEQQPEEEPAAAFVQLREVNKHETSKPTPPPPVFSGDYKKKNQHGVIDLLIKFTQEAELIIKETETQETNDQKAYEDMMQKTKENRAAKAQSANDAKSELATQEENKSNAEAELSGTNTELMQVVEMIADLHKKCDFLTENYDLREELRTQEVDNLKNAKSTLQGADLS